MKKRFQVLRIIANVLKILAIVVAAVALVAGLVTFVIGLAGGQVWNMAGLDSSTGFLTGLVGSFAIILGGALYALMMYGYGELIFLLLALEENTHSTVQLLEKANKEEPPVA